MDTTTIDTRDEGERDGFDDDPGEQALPVRSRRKFLNGTTALLIATITAAGGFYAGVRVEKGQTTSTASAGFPGTGSSLGRSAIASRLRSLFGAPSGAASAAGPAAGAGSGAAPGVGGGFAARLGSGGTVSSVSGNTITLSEASGNTVKVTLGPETKVSKTQSVSRHAVRPGDTIVVQGATKPSGAIVATSVTDTGNNAGSAPSSSSGTAGGGGLSSLFSSGG